MSEPNEQNQSTDEKKPGGTLDLNNISINTLKDDLAEESGGEAKEDKSGWLSFLAKHKKEEPAAAPSTPPTPEPISNPVPESAPPVETKPEPTDDALGQALDQFKSESEKKTTVAAAEAPSNLPISDSEPGSAPETPADKPTEADESPALGSFFPPKEETPEEKEESPGITHLAPPLKETSPPPADEVKTGKIPTLSSEIGDKPAEKPIEKNPFEEKEENKNPFSSRIQPVEQEKKSLLQSVESALNYSAPPEFSETREKQANPPAEEGKVVDLREKTGPAAGGLLKNKKMLLIIGGGVGGFVIIVMVILAMSLGGGKKTVSNANTNTNQANKNQNTSPITQLNTNVAAQPKPVALTAQKFLANTLEKNVPSVNSISQEIQNLKEEPVNKQTQLIFTKPDGSVISFQDLTSATGMNFPQKIIPQPGTTPALIFADFFRGQNILGLAIPTSDSPEVAFSKMQDWENTMVLDLDYLWEGIDIDNKGAYFADSQLFKNARFALIDKRDKLSLDYAVDTGYILITCGRDSMTILKNNFITPSSGSGTVQFESTTTQSSNNSNTNNSTTTGNTETTLPGSGVNTQTTNQNTNGG